MSGPGVARGAGDLGGKGWMPHHRRPVLGRRLNPPAGGEAAENEVARPEESFAVSPPPPTAVAPSAASAPADAASTFRSGVAAPAWRASGGVVERSRDHGQTWQPVPTPAGVRAIAGASVAPDVCWAISADAVLRTTDGVTWTRTLRPSTQALQSIAATSAKLNLGASAQPNHVRVASALLLVCIAAP